MFTAKVAPDLSLALARAASQRPRCARSRRSGGRAGCWPGSRWPAGWSYRVSLWLHPFAMCRRCGGTGITSRLPALDAGVLLQVPRPRAGAPVRHQGGRRVGAVAAVTAAPRNADGHTAACRAPGARPWPMRHRSAGPGAWPWRRVDDGAAAHARSGRRRPGGHAGRGRPGRSGAGRVRVAAGDAAGGGDRRAGAGRGAGCGPGAGSRSWRWPARSRRGR